jgi:protoporphyrinogen oxidase
LAETIPGRARRTRHLDGSFYYPSGGIGRIAEALARQGGDALRTGAAVTRVCHDGAAIRAVEINGVSRLPVERVVTTIPIDLFLQLLDPPPPAEVAAAANSFRFRNLILVAFFLDGESITRHATVYFPDPSVPFTRAYEPRNRCELMAPPGQTSLVVEVPCDEGDDLWNAGDDELAGMVWPRLADVGWLPRDRNPESCVVRMRQAYPVSIVGAEDRLRTIETFLSRFTNLRSNGRNACFEYTWMHVLLRRAKDLVDDWCKRT